MEMADIGVKTGTQPGLANNPQMEKWMYKVNPIIGSKVMAM